jgi:hypothetical protein
MDDFTLLQTCDCNIQVDFFVIVNLFFYHEVFAAQLI